MARSETVLFIPCHVGLGFLNRLAKPAESSLNLLVDKETTSGISSPDQSRTSIADSHRGLFYVLFSLFETLLIGSVVVALCTDRRRDAGIDAAAGWTFWFAFIGLFIVSFILRRTARRLAVIGWLTLFVGFWSVAMTPVL